MRKLFGNDKLKHDFFLLALFLIALSVIFKFNWELSAYPFALGTDQINDLEGLHSFFVHTWQDFKQIYFYHNPGPYHGFLSLFVPAFFAKILAMVFGPFVFIYIYKILAPLLHLVSYLLLVYTFLKPGKKRLLGFLFLLGLPFNCFFLFVPRTESYQLFFISLSFIFFEKRKQKYAALFFLGLATFTHLSSLFFIPFILWHYRINFKEFLIFIFSSLFSAPQLLTWTGMKDFVSSKYLQVLTDSNLDSTLNLSKWLNNSVSLYTYFWPLSFILILFLCFKIRISIKKKELKQNSWEVILLVPSLILFFYIVLFIKISFSAYYLQLPFVFFFLLLVRLNRTNKKSLDIIYLLFSILLIFSRQEERSYSRIGFHYSPFINFKKRPDFIFKENLCQKFRSFFEKESKGRKIPQHIFLPEDYFLCVSNQYVSFKAAWAVHPFLAFFPDRKNNDGIILPIKHYLPKYFQYDKNLSGRPLALKGLNTYKKWVTSEYGGTCSKNCLQVKKITSEDWWFSPP